MHSKLLLQALHFFYKDGLVQWSIKPHNFKKTKFSYIFYQRKNKNIKTKHRGQKTEKIQFFWLLYFKLVGNKPLSS